MLRLVIDTEGLDSEADPRVVYLGHSASKAQEAIDAALGSTHLSMTEVTWLRRAKKTPIAPVEMEAPEEEKPEVESDGLDDLTIDDLELVAEDEGIDLSGTKLKQEIVDAIRAFRALDEAHNLDAIKEIAKTEGVETKGFARKAEFLNAVLAHRGLNPQG